MKKEEQIIFRVSSEEKAKYNKLKKSVDFPKLFREMINSVGEVFPVPCGKINSPLSDYQMSEFKKCKNDILYFAKKYVYVQSVVYGNQLYSYDYPLMTDLLTKMTNHSKIIGFKARQVGMSTAEVLYALWRITFFDDIRITFLAHNSACAQRIQKLFCSMRSSLPDWLRTELLPQRNNCMELEFVNHCSIVTRPLTDGYRSVNSLFATHEEYIFDEAAFADRSAFVNFVDYIEDSLTTQRIFMFSTPAKIHKEGDVEMNHFTEKFLKSQKDPSWITTRIAWYDIPGRTEEWKQVQINTFNGDENRFNSEYSCIF